MADRGREQDALLDLGAGTGHRARQQASGGVREAPEEKATSSVTGGCGGVAVARSARGSGEGMRAKPH